MSRSVPIILFLAEIFTYYSSIILNSFGYLLFSKLCWHNPSRPRQQHTGCTGWRCCWWRGGQHTGCTGWRCCWWLWGGSTLAGGVAGGVGATLAGGVAGGVGAAHWLEVLAGATECIFFITSMHRRVWYTPHRELVLHPEFLWVLW